MIPDLAGQLVAASPRPELIDLRTTYQIKPGSQVDRVLALLDESEKAWTYEDLAKTTGFSRNAINVAVFRLRRAGPCGQRTPIPGANHERALPLRRT